MRFSNTFVALGLISSVIAHPGPHNEHTGADIQRRGAMSKRCASAAGAMNKKRFNKRNAQQKGEIHARNIWETIQNDTCVLTPEVTEGPYVWPRSQTLRQNMTEDQIGVPFTLDVGVLDMATCEPLEDVLVDFWHCNATGSYSSFTGLSPNTAFPVLLQELGIDDFELGVTDLHTDDTTWLRGMWPTDANGMMEMNTIVPGFYVGRSIHIHVQVHTNWTLHSNGTIESANIVSTGQIYLNETISEQLMALEPYVSHTEIDRTTNDVDSVYASDFVGGYNPVIDLWAADGEDIANGVIGYITIGVDTTAIETDFTV